MIKLIDVRKKFGDKWVTQGVDLEIPEGKITCVIGRSGEGKSVLLKQIVGLIRPTSGSIIIDGVDITTLSDQDLEENFKKFGYVFQFAALLDSLNVFENIGITLLELGMNPDEVMPLVEEKLRLVHLESDTLLKYPSELSGGMRKRVGLARTLMTKPTYMLYDEPTTGLDPITARIIHELIYSVQQQYKFTSIIISHDVEIFKYVDYVALLDGGEIKYFGDAKTIWESDNPYIFQFIRGLAQGPIQTDIPHTSQAT
jgi:phospholipid/cholesterol/gamma-HCH transport system ATP-binding protein